ncbi:hypothetical protein AB0N89_16835 [Amycolatopsis sp. NPDC089917]|uniref:hypothetical protein n=1 Tax=Amycolatopsis sp. NPDC089917 TaxID=3155187 RepID=UPI00343EC025
MSSFGANSTELTAKANWFRRRFFWGKPSPDRHFPGVAVELFFERTILSENMRSAKKNLFVLKEKRESMRSRGGRRTRGEHRTVLIARFPDAPGDGRVTPSFGWASRLSVDLDGLYTAVGIRCSVVAAS